MKTLFKEINFYFQQKETEINSYASGRCTITLKINFIICNRVQTKNHIHTLSFFLINYKFSNLRLRSFSQNSPLFYIVLHSCRVTIAYD